MILTKQHQSLAVLIGLGLVGTYFVGRLAASKAVDAAGRVATAVNPVSQGNLLNQFVVKHDGPDRGEKLFAVLDILNPFNRSDIHARNVLGLSNELEALTNGKN